MSRVMRSNLHRQPGRVEGHGENCADCKPDDWVGRAAERRAWMAEAANDRAADRSEQ